MEHERDPLEERLPAPAAGPPTAAAACSNGANTTPLPELWSRANAAIKAGLELWREAAEALAAAQEQHEVTQAEMASAVGKSEAWVSMLLRWRRSGYEDESPFGPKTKAARVQHAKARAACGASKPRRSRKTPTDLVDTRDADESVAYDANAATGLIVFKAAVDHFFVTANWPAQCEGFRYFKSKMTPPPHEN